MFPVNRRKIRRERQISLSMGDTVRFTFKGSVAHVFSKETEKNLEY